MTRRLPSAALLSLTPLAARTGPSIGGLLNDTLGNAAELIICVVAFFLLPA